MSYILAVNFGITGQNYYINTCDIADSFKEIYDPQFATEFATKEAALNWATLNTDWLAYIKVVNKPEAIAKYNEWTQQGTVRRVINKINTTYSRPYNNESKEEVLDWWFWYHDHDDEIKFEDYKTWPDLYKLFKHIWDVAPFDDDATTVTLYTAPDGNFEEFKQELDLVLDRITYKTKEGFLYFPIFDLYLSEGGNTATLLYRPETGKAEIILSHIQSREYTSLEKAFEYLKQNRYYK